MPHPFPLASVFSGGMRRDVDRTEIPGGSAYNMVDFIPDEVQAVTAGRGGWTYAGPTLSGVTGIASVGYHPDADKVVAAGVTGALWDVAAGTLIGAAAAGGPVAPFFHRGYLIYPTPISGAHQPVTYDGSVIGSLAGAPTAPRCGTVYKDHSVLGGNFSLASNNANSHRIWFSAAGDPTTWDLTFGWWDTSNSVVALGSLLNSMLIFHPDSTERLRGTTPPPGSDMTLEPFLPNVGCIDQRSVAYWQNRIVFASSQGVYLTDGATAVDLTANAQLKTYWQSAIMANYVSGGFVQFSGGVYRDHYIISITNTGTNTLIDCLCFSLQNQAAWRFTNLQGVSFVNVVNGQKEKLYAGFHNDSRVADLSSMWSPSASVKQDANGVNPTPIIETGMFRGFDRLHRRWIESMGKQKWRWSYVDYDLRDSAADNPTATLSYCTTPTGSYTQAGLTLPKTTDVSRVRRSLNPTQGGATRSQMLGLKYAVTGPYASAKLLTLEGVFEPIDIGQL